MKNVTFYKFLETRRWIAENTHIMLNDKRCVWISNCLWIYRGNSWSIWEFSKILSQILKVIFSCFYCITWNAHIVWTYSRKWITERIGWDERSIDIELIITSWFNMSIGYEWNIEIRDIWIDRYISTDSIGIWEHDKSKWRIFFGNISCDCCISSKNYDASLCCVWSSCKSKISIDNQIISIVIIGSISWEKCDFLSEAIEELCLSISFEPDISVFLSSIWCSEYLDIGILKEWITKVARRWIVIEYICRNSIGIQSRIVNDISGLDWLFYWIPGHRSITSSKGKRRGVSGYF